MSPIPYITPSARERIAAGGHPQVVGELTYVLTKAVVDYIENRGGPTYAILAEAKIACMDTLLELDARVCRDYEQLKCALNGDVFGPILDTQPKAWPLGHGDPPPRFSETLGTDTRVRRA